MIMRYCYLYHILYPYRKLLTSSGSTHLESLIVCVAATTTTAFPVAAYTLRCQYSTSFRQSHTIFPTLPKNFTLKRNISYGSRGQRLPTFILGIKNLAENHRKLMNRALSKDDELAAQLVSVSNCAVGQCGRQFGFRHYTYNG